MLLCQTMWLTNNNRGPTSNQFVKSIYLGIHKTLLRDSLHNISIQAENTTTLDPRTVVQNLTRFPERRFSNCHVPTFRCIIKQDGGAAPDLANTRSGHLEWALSGSVSLRLGEVKRPLLLLAGILVTGGDEDVLAGGGRVADPGIRSALTCWSRDKTASSRTKPSATGRSSWSQHPTGHVAAQSRVDVGTASATLAPHRPDSAVMPWSHGPLSLYVAQLWFVFS